MNIIAGIIGGWEMVLILAVVLVLFGAKKVPELAKGLGQGIKEFKKASREVTEEINSSMDDHHNNPPPAPKKLPAATVSTETHQEAAQTTPTHKA